MQEALPPLRSAPRLTALKGLVSSVYFKVGRGFFVMILVANQKPRFLANPIDSLITISIDLGLISYKNLLHERCLDIRLLASIDN